MIINLKASIEKTNGRITQKFLAKTLGRPRQTINNWVRTNSFHDHANDRLIGIFKENGVEPEYI
jgi:DNA-binding transcriptional regulator YiaG